MGDIRTKTGTQWKKILLKHIFLSVKNYSFDEKTRKFNIKVNLEYIKKFLI